MEDRVLSDREGVELDEEEEPIPVDVQINSGKFPKDFTWEDPYGTIEGSKFSLTSEIEALDGADIGLNFRFFPQDDDYWGDD